MRTSRGGVSAAMGVLATLGALAVGFPPAVAAAEPPPTHTPSITGTPPTTGTPPDAVAAGYPAATVEPPVDHVVIVGAAGLRWDDVNRRDMPHLWELVGRAAVGSLVVRSAQEYTCPADGWLTLGAGNRVRLSTGRGADDCRGPLPEVEPRRGGGATVAGQSRVLEDNENLTHQARPGALAELVDCSVAVGRGAAVAAARPGVGRVDRYQRRLPSDPAPLLASCPLAVVDAGTVNGPDRRAAARRADAVLGRVLEARPERSMVIVAGVADVTGPARLHVAAVAGPQVRASTLTSWRPGYARLVDLAPTAANALGVPRSRWFAGVPLPLSGDDSADAGSGGRSRDGGGGSGRDRDTAGTLRTLVDADHAATEQQNQARWFIPFLVLIQLTLYLAAFPVLQRIRRAAVTEDATRPVWTAAERVLEVAAVAAAMLIPSAMLADLVNWWRSDTPGLVLAVVTLVVTALSTAAIRLVPWWRAPLGPVASVAAVAGGVITVDLVTGGTLQLDNVVGYSAVEGGRIAGISAAASGVFAVAVLFGAGYLGHRVARHHAPLAVAGLGVAGVTVAGVAGLDPGGAIALTAGVCLAMVVCTGGWLTPSRLLSATLIGFLVTAGFVLLSLYPRPEDRSRLGQFFTDVSEGVPGALLHRTAEANAITFLSSPFTVLAIGGALFGGLVLLRPAGGLLRVYGLYPGMRAALLGSALATVLGGLVDGAATVVVGAATSVALPMAILMCLRVLARAHLRTAPRLPPELAPDAEEGSDRPVHQGEPDDASDLGREKAGDR